MKNESLILAVVPGNKAFGIARVAANGAIVWRKVVPPSQIERALNELSSQPPEIVVVSSGAHAKAARNLLIEIFGLDRVHAVEGSDSAEEAKKLYFADHPPSGLWKFLPRSMVSPSGPIDAYLAVVLARRWLAESGRKT